MKTDVAICTYQSEKYLDQCLTSIEKSVPVNRLIIVDHYSTDRTVEIANKHNALIYFENVGLGYARQIAMELVETSVFLFVDSDVVFHSYDWFPKALSLIDEQKKVGGVGLWTPPRLPPWRQKYVNFWWGKIPQIKRHGFVNAYLILKKAVEDIKIPSILGAYEHVYIAYYMKKYGWTVKVMPVKGIHYYDFPNEKGAWLGAGQRVFLGIRPLPKLLFRRVLTAALKAVPPAFTYNDPSVIINNTMYWIKFLKGWLRPERYINLKRKRKNRAI